MMLATSSWYWSQFATLSLLVVIPALLVFVPKLRKNKTINFALILFTLLLIYLVRAGYYHGGYFKAGYFRITPCPELIDVGLGFFASIGTLCCSFRLLFTKFWWLIVVPVIWLIYYTPFAISDLAELWEQAASFQ